MVDNVVDVMRIVYRSTPSGGTVLNGCYDVDVCYCRINHFVVNVL